MGATFQPTVASKCHVVNGWNSVTQSPLTSVTAGDPLGELWEFESPSS